MAGHQAEPFQASNPHKLTRRQHVQPSSWIAKFSGSDGQVERLDKVNNWKKKYPPSHEAFVVFRLWEQRAETLTQPIEIAFLEAMRSVVACPRKTIADRYHAAFSAMFGLWEIRAHLRRKPPRDVRLEGVQGPRGLPPEWTKDEEEQLERAGFTLQRSGADGISVVPGRMLTWIMIRGHIHRTTRGLDGAKWCVRASSGADFVCPDQPHPERVLLLPLSPSICVTIGQYPPYAEVLSAEVQRVNRILIEGAERFYFSRDLDNCPT